MRVADSGLERCYFITYVYFSCAAACTEIYTNILAEQVEQRCPVANLFLAAGTRMDIEWVPATEQHEKERRETNVKI